MTIFAKISQTGMKEKIAFTVTRYGKDINGGAELHCRMLAERLAEEYDVEVLTTGIKNYVTGEKGYEDGVEVIGGVTVRRFRTEPETLKTEKKWLSEVRMSRRVRRLLYWCGLLKYVARAFPVWKWGLEADLHAFKSSIFYSPAMFDYLREHKSEYKVIISITATYAPFVFTALSAGEKMIGIPTLHPERSAFRPALSLAFSKINTLGFNTGAEQKLAENIFGLTETDGECRPESCIISTGIEDSPSADWDATRAKFGLPQRYIVFIGRIEKGKTGKLVEYYIKYSESHPDVPKLVMVGGVVKEVGRHENIIYTGFVTDEEKRAILSNALLLVNPSKYESLSLVVLEALRDNVPVLVNGRCNVLKEHCVLSGGAVASFTDYGSYCGSMDKILGDSGVRGEMIEKGRAYYSGFYTWETILPRLIRTIDKF